jgi:hypothetical protein
MFTFRLLIETNLRGLCAFEFNACILGVICYKLVFLLQVSCCLDNVHNMKGVGSGKSDHSRKLKYLV